MGRRPVLIFRPLRRAGLVGAALALAACSATVTGHGSSALTPAAPSFPSSSSATAPGGSFPSSSSSSSGPPAANCPPRATPDPNRPKMALDFTISPDHRTVRGTEIIGFTPDLPIHELVFRLTANTRPTVAEGNRIVVESATAEPGGKHFRFTSANAARSTQGGLLRIPFASTVPAGKTVTARITFTVTLGANSFDRFGRAGKFAYFGSAEPLLAWQRGYGWHTEDLIDFPAESATSEVMDVDLNVHAPAQDTVIMSGDPADPPAASSGLRDWHAHLDAARDVSVAAGPFAVSDTTVDGVRLRLGAPTPAIRDALVPEFHRAITQLSQLFGRFPFPSLSVARVPAQGGGIEYPSSILMLDGSRLVAVHETAHQWFYAMVGDSQAQHPWMDEGFAEYAEQLVDQTPPEINALGVPGAVDRSTESYGHDEYGYYYVTYNKAAAALRAARQAAGPQTWDSALRCYVAANAWRIAVPADFERAIASLPAALAPLRRAGALP